MGFTSCELRGIIQIDRMSEERVHNMGEECTQEKAITLLSAEGDDVERLYRVADGIRQETMGDAVHIRGIVEFSNVCRNNCLYCGIRNGNSNVRRYTLAADEILGIAGSMADAGQMTIVLQAGEAPGPGDTELGHVVRRIKEETPLAVTLSVGNRPRETYEFWKKCGMDRYFLRFETSDAGHFQRLHPGSSLAERLTCLRWLKELDVQTGSGFMIGLPGETVGILADNILLCRNLDLDMIGIGPFIPHPDTPLGDAKNAYDDREMFFKALSVLRVFNPYAHIPATTAFDALFPGRGRDLCLQRGANVFMPNNTPVRHRGDYLLYPDKPGVDDDGETSGIGAVLRIEALGRTVGKGPGHSVKRKGPSLNR